MFRALVAAVLALTLAGGIGQRMGAARSHAPDSVELPLFPSGRLLQVLSLGHQNGCADLAWLQAIQYYGRHHQGDRTYPLARHLFYVTTALDPGFRNAYIFGAWVLGEEAGDMAGARRLLRRGMRANPTDWMLAFQRGFLEYMEGDPALGALQMERASRIRGAPPYTSRLAAQACARTGQVALAIRLWEEIERSGEAAIRSVARQRLQELREREMGNPIQRP